MDGLRWLLLLFGLLVIAGVYLYSRRDKETVEEDDVAPGRVEPSLDGDNSIDESMEESDDTSVVDAGDADRKENTPSPTTPQKIVTVRIVAREKKSFAGDELILSMRGIGLRHGKFGIFHRYDGNDESQTVFSAASLVEPGSFDLQNIKGQEIPGISLFLVLPGPLDCVEGFDMMLAAARTLTQSLDGELLDESGSTLSIQRERYLREEIIQFQHSNLVS
jgi:cell division protein ZipA